VTDPFDIYCLGDALIDLLPNPPGSLREARRFEAHLGGAVANVAVGLSRLGRGVYFQGVLGEDEFGHSIAERLREEGVATRIRHTREAPTCLSFVALEPSGERSFFTPARSATADKYLEPGDIDEQLLARARWLHVGTNIHVNRASREALLKAVRFAKARGIRLSFDPNVRAHLWDDLELLRTLCRELIPLCDLVKLSEEELELCTGANNPAEAIGAMTAQGVSLACVTLGARGVVAGLGTARITAEAPVVQAIDTTGAGDGFVAALLSRLARVSPASLTPTQLEPHLRFACWAAARVCTFFGAVPGLPRRADVPEQLRSVS